MSDTALPLTKAAAPLNEDLVALILGLLVVGLAIVAALSGTDLMGWVVSSAVYTDVTKSLAPASKVFAGLGGLGSLAVTFVVLVGVLTGAATLLGLEARRFLPRVAAVFALAYASWLVGSYAHFAAVTPGDFKKFGIDWSLRLTNEGGFIVALIVGIVIANAFPRFADWLREAALPELYIKVAVVVLGAFLATTFAGKLNFASTVVLRGIAAIVEAYLIYWAVVYYVARRYFRFNREFAVPLASGISICGVAAAIATGSAIRARPDVPILVSSLVVVFAVVEVLILPFLAQTFLWHEPLVAAAWMGLAVKTDGAAVAAGGITDALVLAKNAANGVAYQKDSLLAVTTAIKIFIDVFIGVWAFILAFIWTRYINTDQEKARPIEIWQRFPKFIIGFALAFGVVLAVALSGSKPTQAAIAASVKVANNFRVIFFILTFFSIGLLSDFKRLWSAGIGKLAAVYVVSLFGFVIWVGLLISWLFFAGVKPPLA
ncbi:putative membrane protein YadS [Beijerinckiaceae bacterium RH AL1]|nr:putative sulfate exporter family transporter [Beijerinckiaceae bacterium]VVB47154.1 putative membrane protein YadS [Beijerinckiaceae bacterium RH CH11]VVB47237.1 putative membrane protein YadS [Beijerinckiaceae bacterium RH AL8]VVC55742.1 putative membrane protein YadS [Beijerinckiaceae bacterium RH AL1]